MFPQNTEMLKINFFLITKLAFDADNLRTLKMILCLFYFETQKKLNKHIAHVKNIKSLSKVSLHFWSLKLVQKWQEQRQIDIFQISF